MTNETFNARSWLFAPGDSEKKMQKAADSAADIALFDLEDAVAEAEKPRARERVLAFLQSQGTDRSRLWVRINPLQEKHALTDLAAIMPGRPGGIMVPKTRSGADLVVLDHYLSALEAANGIEQGSTKVFPLVTETAEGMLTTGSYAGAPRLVAMTWGAEDLGAALGALTNKEPDGAWTFPYQVARAQCLFAANAAGALPLETLYGDFKNPEGLAESCRIARRDGFVGRLAIHPNQVEIINSSFTPSEEDLAHARRVLAAFAASPDVGTVGIDGKMYDMPHLIAARRALASAGEG